jgi:hypothetical protein
MESEENVWDQLPEAARVSLSSSWSLGMPAQASAVHSRWWLLETWLRSLCYVELRAKYGQEWMSKIPSKTMNNAKKEAALAYMASSDSELVLSYLDVFDLFDLIESEWGIFECSLLDREVWHGRTKELRQIRHRSAHCRRPHVDELGRIEQTLRDLEKGAFHALSSFNNREVPVRTLDDPLVQLWMRDGHPTARRLIDHAESNYHVSFRLNFSRRPWAAPYEEGAPVSGNPGYLWHAAFTLHGGGYEMPFFWGDSYVDRASVKDEILFACGDSPYNLDVSFPAVRDPIFVANAIGNCFDAILIASRQGWQEGGLNQAPGTTTDRYRRWEAQGARLGPRVQAMTAWAFVDETTTPISIFGS